MPRTFVDFIKSRPENPWKRGHNTQYFRARDSVLARKPMCYKCKTKLATEVDHVRPLIRGGSNTVRNLRPICMSCNRKSGGGERRLRKSVQVDAMVAAAIKKASFGGDRSAAGRYAAEQRWKNHQKKEDDKKGRGAKSPLAQSIIEANESLSKAGITVRVVEMDNSESEAMKKLSGQLLNRIIKSARIISKTKNFAPLTQERWFFEAVNLMKSSVKVEKGFIVGGKAFIIIAEKGDAIVGAMRFVPDVFIDKYKDQEGGKIPSAGSLRVAKGVGTAMFGEALKLAAKTGKGKIKIEALDTAEGFWKAQGFQRVEGAKLKDNSTYDMTMDGKTIQTLAKEISS